MTDKERKELTEEIKKDLFASQDILIISALDKIKKHGNEALVEPMLHVYVDSDNEQITSQIDEMLSCLKISSAEKVLVDSLNKPELVSIQSNIISYIWNSGFQPADRIHDIIRVCVEGDYMTTLEGLTLIENMDGPFEEEHLMDALLNVKEKLIELKEKSDDKSPLLIELHSLLNSYLEQRVLD